MDTLNAHKHHRPIANWLFITAGFVFAMVVIGAITRLTESGLSMVEWRPLIGALPPMSDAEWARVFDLYQQTPEFQKKNSWMDINEFKTIFFWEWFHRFWGRLIGLVYGLPFFYFLLSRKTPKGYGLPLTGLLILGGLQGLMGWYMVKSGLVDQPAVSHYRLAAHLGLAFLIFALLIWYGLKIKYENTFATLSNPALYIHGWASLGFLILTIFWGAYVAGLDAGMIYNEYPTMGAGLVPPDMWAMAPAWVNIFENHAAVQFTHRWLAALTVLVLISFWIHGLKKDATSLPLHLLGLVALLQFALGIATILTQVWLPLGVLHQAGALLLLMVLVMNLFRYRPVAGARSSV